MTRIERYEEQVDSLRRRRSAFLQAGKYVQAIALGKDIACIEGLLEDFKKTEIPRDIRDLLTEEQIEQSGLKVLLAEIHLAADFLVSCEYTLMDICNKYNIQLAGPQRNLKDIIAKTNGMVSDLMEKNGWVEDLLESNDTLNEALHKKIMSFMKQRKAKKDGNKSGGRRRKKNEQES